MNDMVLSNRDIEGAAAITAANIERWLNEKRFRTPRRNIKLYGVPRGGVPVAYLLARLLECAITDVADDAHIIVDDLVDSGATREVYHKLYPAKPFFALYDKRREPPLRDAWLVFPWEVQRTGDDVSATDIPVRLLQFIGENPEREGLKETPQRFLKAWKEYTAGYTMPSDAEILKVFADGAERYDELVLMRDIPVHSHCEHHLAPFIGHAHVAYIPNGKVVGLSKLARITHKYAKRLQVQERMTQQIANALHETLAPKGVGVIVKCRHMCMECRGVQVHGAETTTSCLLGVMRDSAQARAEFLELVR